LSVIFVEFYYALIVAALLGDNFFLLLRCSFYVICWTNLRGLC